MENNTEQNNEKQTPTKNPFWIGVLMTILLFLCLYVIYLFYQNSEQAKRDAELERVNKARAGIVADSLKIVNENKLKYQKMVYFINTRDSIRSLLRYKIGDVVYLKPDSVRCVIMDISSDSTLSAYSYVLISNNKNNDPGLIIRNDKLIY